jgi:uncharacterized protein DUF2589
MALVIDPATPLTLGQIVGEILSALVQAQARAAQTTVEFIDSVGFKPGSGTDAASLRTVQFKYQKPDENQTPAEFVVEIPLLGMVDIPLICIKNATLKLDYEVSTAAETEVQDAGGKRTKIAQLKGRVLSGRTSPSERATISVSVDVAKADLPPGLARALDILEVAAKETKAG